MVTSLQSHYLRLLKCDDISHNGFCRLLKGFGSLAGILAAAKNQDEDLSTKLDAAGFNQSALNRLVDRIQLDHPDQFLLDNASAWLREDPDRRQLLCFEDPDYPPLLREIDCPPALLFVAGNPHYLTLPQLAIVGSRRASENGKHTASWLSQELATAGFCIVSGLAAGIDAQAHRGALAGGGKTVAIMGTGIDRIYPAGHRQLARQLVSEGALVTEFPLGTPPIPGNFPRRNRIIAGLALGVIVVEATPRSGSLITARLAMESNREVFAIPGSIYSSHSRGCHRLIRDGAKLADGVDSILEELAGPLQGLFDSTRRTKNGDDQQVSVAVNNRQTENAETLISEKIGSPTIFNLKSGIQELKSDERKLLQVIGFDPFPAELAAHRSGLGIERVSQLLSALEMKGLLQQTAGCYQRMAGGLHQESD